MTRTAIATVVAAGLSAGCVTNPVGPVASFDAYREKASSSIDDAVSSVATVQLAGQAELDGSSFTAYAVQIADDSLDGVRTAQDTFETVVPPDAEAETLQGQVLDALATSRRAVTDVLTALQVGDGARLSAAVAALDPLTSELDELAQQLDGSEG